MTDPADAVILIIALVGFALVIGFFNALFTVIGYVIDHYRRVKGISRW